MALVVVDRVGDMVVGAGRMLLPGNWGCDRWGRDTGMCPQGVGLESRAVQLGAQDSQLSLPPAAGGACGSRGH